MQLGGDVGDEVADGDALLFHRVAVAEGDGVVFEGIEVDGDAKRGAEFVLAAVPFADGARFVVLAVPEGLEGGKDGLGFFGEGLFFHEGENGHFDGGDAGGEVEHGAHFAVFELFLFIGVAEEGEEGSLNAKGGFDDVGNKFFSRLGIGVVDRLTGAFCVAGEVKIGPVGEAVEFAGSKGKVVDEVDSALRVVGELLFGVLFFMDASRFQPNALAPAVHLLEPRIESFFPGGFSGEVLNFHLFEFDDSKHKVAGGDFVAEGFADLGDAEGEFNSNGIDDIFVVEEDGLGRFGAQVGDVAVGAGLAHVGLKHEVEVARLGKIGGATFGAFDFVFMDQIGHLREVQVVRILMQGLFDEVVAAEAAFTGFAVDEGVAKSIDVARGFPCFGMEENRAVETDHVSPLVDEHLPPEVLDVPF